MAAPPNGVPRPGSGFGSLAVLFVPTAGVLAMVAAIVLVNVVNSTWVLIPVMILALIAVLAVMATIMRMLADGEKPE
jgi:hypothetical protein